MVMVFKAPFNNICYIVAGETGENHQPAASQPLGILH
jgi:hypothetical protein